MWFLRWTWQPAFDKEIVGFVYFTTLYTLLNHWTLILNFSEICSTLSFRRYYSLCPNFLPGFESTWLTTTTGLRTGCRSRFSWIGRRSSVAGFGPFPPLPCCWFSKGWFQTKKIYTKVGLGSELFFYDVYSKLWKSGPVMFFLVDCLSLDLHCFGFFYPWKRVLNFKQDCLKNWGAMVRVQGKDLIHAYFHDFVFSMF